MKIVFKAENSEQPMSFLEQNPYLLKLCLLVMFVLAALLRQHELHVPGDLLEREYTSAIFARAYYFTRNADVEDWRREIAIITKNQQPVLEPPLLEYLVSLIYQMMGKEEIFYARYLTNAFWLIGGLTMYSIAKHFLTTDVAIIATAYYLFVPKGIIISRSFQPDSLMMMMFLLSLYLVIRYFERPTTSHLVLASCIAGITLVLRPLVLFSIFCVFIVLSIHKKQSWKNILDIPLITFTSLSLLPLALYYGYGIVFAGFMRWKLETSFMPHLLTKRGFWQGWFELGTDIVGQFALILAIIGFFILQNKMLQHLVIGLAIGYLIFGIAFTYHIHTHGYYHIQLFPLIGLCIAPLVAGTLRALIQMSGKTWLIPVSAVIAVMLYFSHKEVRENLYSFHFEDLSIAREIGALVHHSPRTVFVAHYYGIPLEYYGEFSGAAWPVSVDDPFYRPPSASALSVEERMDALGFIPEYFVVTNFELYDRIHTDLRIYLERECSRRVATSSYLIYSSCQITAGKDMH